MTKQKTRKELERGKEGLVMVAIVGWVFFIFTLGISIYTFETVGHPNDLSEQLQECQDKVPDCIFTLTAKEDGIITSINGSELEYQIIVPEGESIMIKHKDCEVIE